MRLLEHFDEAYYERQLGRQARLHLWVPPTPNDSGVTVGAAYLGAYQVGAGIGARLEHAFYCGGAPKAAEIRAAFDAAPVTSPGAMPARSPMRGSGMPSPT